MLRFMLVAIGMLAAVGPASAVLSTSADTPFLQNSGVRPDNVGVQYAEKYKWKAGGCKYEYKADKKGFKEKYKCK